MEGRVWASHIAIFNVSELVTDADVARIAEACRRQVNDQVEPAYGMAPINVEFFPHERRDEVAPGSQVVAVFNSDGQARKAGFYGDDPEPKTLVYGTGVIRDDGLSYARVFAELCRGEDGSINVFEGERSVSCSVSHEVVEARVDSYLNRWAVGTDGRLYAYEACDPVEDDAYPITLDDGQAVSVSNFVLARWFDPQAKGGHFDFMNKLSEPFSRLKGGYVLVYNPTEVKPKVKMEPDEGLLDETRRDSKHSLLARTRWRTDSMIS
jgi:hypothetical protein